MGRKASTPMTFDVNCNESRDVLLTPDRFALRKDQLLPELRARADAPPRQMRPGTGQRADWWANLAQRREACDGTLVRGFCLYELPGAFGNRRKMVAWRCCFHMVVETRTPSGRVVYEDPNEARRTCDAGAAYIFVPSTRAHADLSDEQLLSGAWLLGSVLLGDAAFCSMVLAQEQGRGRRSSVVALSPEALVAKRNLAVRLLPHFVTWMRLRAIEENPETLGEMMGMPVHEPGAAEDEAGAAEAYRAVAANPESYVNGVEGLALELSCREGLFAGTLSFAEAKERFFSYYDRTYHAMRQAQLDAVTDRLVSLQIE